MIGMFRAFVFSSQFPLLRLCLCLYVQLPAPLQGQSSSPQQRDRAVPPALSLPGRAAPFASSGRTARGGCGLWSVQRVPRPPRVSGRGLCHRSAAWPKGWGTRVKEVASNERVPSRSSEPFGETRFLQISVPFSAAPPQNELFFSGLSI